jgi:DNA-binding response OmpR family regulator
MDINKPSETIKARILVVDDDPGNLGVLGRLLQPYYNVVAAPSGLRALEIATGPVKPDLILLDVMMPGMSGYTVLDRLQGNAETRGIPVIFVTGMDTEDDEAEGLRMGAVDYIAKPYRTAIVLARVATHLALKEAHSQAGQQREWMEAEVARRTRGLLESGKTPESDNRAEVLAALARKLRVPVNEVIGAAQLLRMSGLSEAQQKQVEDILANAASCLAISNDMRDVG